MGKKLAFQLVLYFFLWKAGMTQQVTLDVKDVSLLTVIAMVEHQAGVYFIFSSEAMKHTSLVTIKVKKLGLQKFMQLCMANQPLDFSIDGKFVLLKTRLESPVLSGILSMQRGKLIDEAGVPVVGATVYSADGYRQAITDHRGEFVIQVQPYDSSLLVSSIEIEPIRWQFLGTDTALLIRATRKISSLDETVVKGYYLSTKRMNTGSVAAVRGDVIEKQPVTNVLSSLQGRSSGIYINTTNGLPGGDLSVLIRGKNSIHAGTEPLFLLDGIPLYSNTVGKTGMGNVQGFINPMNPIHCINPDAIASVQFLKDADATAIYGARAGNGVVLINTKQPGSETSMLEFSSKLGVASYARQSKLLSLEEYLGYRSEAFRNDNRTPTVSSAPDLTLWDQKKGVDWQEYLLGNTASYFNANLAFSARSQRGAVMLILQRLSQDAIYPGSKGYEKNTANLSYRYAAPSRKFSLQYQGMYAWDKNQPLAIQVMSALSLPPNVPLTNPNGNFSWANIGTNAHPAALERLIALLQTNFQQQRLVAQTNLSGGITGKINMGMNSYVTRQNQQLPSSHVNPSLRLREYLSNSENFHQLFLVEPQLDFFRKLWGWQVNAMLGTSWQSIKESSVTEVDEHRFIKATAKSKHASLFARLNWVRNKEWQINLLLRRDGSSRFGTANQYGNFGALAASWIFSEHFFGKRTNRWLELGKLRFSYGLTGNDRVGDFVFLETFSQTAGYQGLPGWRPDRLVNPSIGWEKIRKSEIGLELAVWGNRAQINAAYYQNISSNQLLEKPIPFTAGPFGSYVTNFPAKLENSGLELDGSIQIIKKKSVEWLLQGNISFQKNRVRAYPASSNGVPSLETVVVGEDLSIRQGYKLLQIDPGTGLPDFLDKNSDGVLTAADFVIIGKTSPSFFGGFGSDFRYKGICISIFFQFVRKNEMGSTPAPGTMANIFRQNESRWKQPGDRTSIPRASSLRLPELVAYGNSDAAMVNASFIRARNISLSYDMPKALCKSLHLKQIKWSVNAQNLFTWHRALNLFDPETLNSGIAPLKTIVVGCTIYL